jgi:hypothetical protein
MQLPSASLTSRDAPAKDRRERTSKFQQWILVVDMHWHALASKFGWTSSEKSVP